MEPDKPRTRDNQGRFLPGNPGKPKGARAVSKTKFKQAVNTQAFETLEKILGKANRLIDRAISDTQAVVAIDEETGQIQLDDQGQPVVQFVGGDTATARWVVDRLLPGRAQLLTSTIDADLSTIDGIMDAAQTAIEMIGERALTLDEGREYLEVLGKFAAMKTFTDVDELKALIERFENDQKKGVAVAHAPSWGNLQPTTPTANRRPAE